ncbi:hypothetical protein [Culex luteo-like virus]|nr:hypothetical protein [Culex luteo-like virus]ASA47485.1 hypothetical protein [Culex luteo-like virus]ASA47519.1 hypothetical protein [Culex luteo-like virus]
MASLDGGQWILNRRSHMEPTQHPLAKQLVKVDAGRLVQYEPVLVGNPDEAPATDVDVSQQFSSDKELLQMVSTLGFNATAGDVAVVEHTFVFSTDGEPIISMELVALNVVGARKSEPIVDVIPGQPTQASYMVRVYGVYRAEAERVELQFRYKVGKQRAVRAMRTCTAYVADSVRFQAFRGGEAGHVSCATFVVPL